MTDTGLLLAAALGLGQANVQTVAAKNFVLAHGSWHGGWCWKRVAERLRAKGHTVYTPSYTGMGDREHLLSKDITIDTFVEDLVEVIQSEELNKVVLVGHSFGGIPISGVADRLPDRIAHLVYLDSVVVESGRSVFSYYPADVAAQIKDADKATNGSAYPVPQLIPGFWGLGNKAIQIMTGFTDAYRLTP